MPPFSTLPTPQTHTYTRLCVTWCCFGAQFGGGVDLSWRRGIFSQHHLARCVLYCFCAACARMHPSFPRARSLGMGSLTTLGTSDSEWHSRAANTGSAARFCLCSVCLRLNINECALVSFIHQTFSQRRQIYVNARLQLPKRTFKLCTRRIDSERKWD